MRKILICVIAAIAAFIAVAEWRVGYCGSGWARPALQFGLVPNWFNGTFQLEDKDGWGILTPYTEISTEQGLIEIGRITRYSQGTDFLVEFHSTKGELFTALIEQGNSARPLVRIQEATEAEASKQLDREWVSVESSSCGYGRWDLIRWILLLTAVAIGCVVLMPNMRRLILRRANGKH